MTLHRFFLHPAAAAAYFALAIVGAPTPGFSATVEALDQHNVGKVAIDYTDLNKKGDDFELLQSFTAGVTGTLDKVALPVYEDTVSPSPGKYEWYNSNLTVTILSSTLGVRGYTIIGAGSIPRISSYDATHNVLDVNALFPLSGAKAISVTKGSLYYIEVQADTIVPDNYAGNGLDWFATAADYSRGGPYGAYNGSLFPFLYNNYDLEFRTYVTPKADPVQIFAAPTGASAAPEPSTWAMMLVGFAGLAYAGYRASRKRALAAS